MNRFSIHALFVGLTLALIARQTSAQQPTPNPVPIQTPANTQDPSKAERHVIVVSLDGLAAYLVDDPKASLPTVRRLATDGAIVSGGMTVSNPSVTWPNHTSLVTGVRPAKHGVLANGLLVRGGPGVPVRVDPKRDSKELVRGQTIVDLAQRSGLRTAEINWPCTRNSPAFNHSFPDVPDALTFTTPALRSHLVKLGVLDDETDKSFANKLGASRDWVWTEAACHLIRDYKPNLMLIHLLNVDSTHHALGPQTSGGYTANALIDMYLERIVRAIVAAGIAEKTTLIVVSDHGFVPTPKAVKPNMLLRKQGLQKEVDGKLTEARAHVIPEGGMGLVYFTNQNETPILTAQIKQLFLGREGIADVVFPDRYSQLGMPLPREYVQAPDALLVLKEGYSVSNASDGEAFVVTNIEGKTSLGSHGFLSTNPKMNGLCVLWGSRVRKGAKLSGVENIDVAPTIAKLLNLNGMEFDGKPIAAAIE